MIKILFVCHGNICRSPMAEFIMKELAKDRPDIYIESKAVSSEEIGNSIYPRAAETLKKQGIPFGGHRARQIKATDYNEFCKQFETKEECNKRKLLCQWGQFTCHVHPAAYGIFK